MTMHRISTRIACALLAIAVCACSSIGPATLPRDRIDYTTAIGESWKQQTLLNIVKLRYGDFPVFLDVAQVVAGYTIATTFGAGFNAANNNNSMVGAFTVGGSLNAQGAFTDRPTLIYAPLTGTNFLKKLMTPIPPGSVLFTLQSGYAADLVMPIAIDSINGINNESRRGMARAADPRFLRLVQLIRDQQLAGAIQVRIEQEKGAPALDLISFAPSKDPQVATQRREIRSILGLKPDLHELKVYYGGYSGKDDEMDMMTRSMLQIMLELSTVVRVPASDVTENKAAPGLVVDQAGGTQAPPALKILSGTEPPSDAFVAVQYQGRWFWIANTDIRSKFSFDFVMLLFSLSDVGSKVPPPVLTIPTG
jgi:hypothetical protein